MDYNGGTSVSNNNQNLAHYNDQYSYDIEYKYKTNTRYQRYLVELLEKEMDHVPNSVLDVGCGQGLNTVKFADDWPNAKIVGVDLSDIGIKYANAHYGSKENVSFICGDVSKMLDDDEKFDLVTAFELLEHIDDWEKVATVMTRISNRYIMVSVPIGRMREYEKEFQSALVRRRQGRFPLQKRPDPPRLLQAKRHRLQVQRDRRRPHVDERKRLFGRFLSDAV